MTPTQLRKLDHQLTDYLEIMTQGLGRTERRAAMSQYVTGLLLEGERKSVEPMAARSSRRPRPCAMLLSLVRQMAPGEA